jgi:hypothetical protein
MKEQQNPLTNGIDVYAEAKTLINCGISTIEEMGEILL